MPNLQRQVTNILAEIENSTSCIHRVEGIGKDKREDGHELHDNVESRTGGVLERITDGVTNNGGLVDVGSLALELGIRGGLLNVLLGIVPGTTGVGHGDGQLHRGDERSDEKTGNGSNAEEDTGEEGSAHNHDTRGDHLSQGGLGGDGNAGIVVGTLGGVGIEKVGLLIKLALNLHNHGHGGLTDRLHGHGGKGKGDHTTDDEEGEGQRLEHVDTKREEGIIRRVTDAGDEGTEQSQRHKGGGSDGETLADGGGGVTGGIEGIGLLTDGGVELGHLGNTSGVVTDRSVNIDGKAGGEVGKEANGGKGDTIHVAEGEGTIDDKGKDDDGDDDGLVSEGNAVDDVGGGTGLARVGNLTDGLVRVGGEVLGEETNHETTDSTHDDANSGLPGAESKSLVNTDGSLELEGGGKETDGGTVDGGDHEDGGGDELKLEGVLNAGLGLDGEDVSGQEGADEADGDTDGRHNDGEDHGIPTTGEADGRADDEGSASGLGEGAEEIGTHTGDVTDVVTDVVGNGGGVAGIVLGDAVDDLADEIGTDVGGLGVDTTTDTSEHGNGGTTEAVSGKRLGQVDPVIGDGVVDTEGQSGEVEHENAQTAEGEAHDGTGAEGGVEAGGPAGLLGGDGGTDVGEDGDLHAEVSGNDGGSGTKDERHSREETTGKVPSGAPGNQDENDSAEDHNEVSADGVLGLEEGLGTLVDGLVDLDETAGGGLVVGAGDEGRSLIDGLGLDGDPGDDQELQEAPDDADDGGTDDDARCGELHFCEVRCRNYKNVCL